MLSPKLKFRLIYVLLISCKFIWLNRFNAALLYDG